MQGKLPVYKICLPRKTLPRMPYIQKGKIVLVFISTKSKVYNIFIDATLFRKWVCRDVVLSDSIVLVTSCVEPIHMQADYAVTSVAQQATSEEWHPD